VNKIIATFPCSDAAALIDFYKQIGFELTGQYTRSYLVFEYEDLEIHFFGSKMYQPHENPTMCCILTKNVEQLYEVFTAGIKARTGKIPRNGFPKISKIRDLSEDRRFTLADPSGNTIYVIERKTDGGATYFRDIANEEHAKQFTVLYDLVYSKEDLTIANNLLPKLIVVKNSFCDIDKAKLLLIEREVCAGMNIACDITELEQLVEKHINDNEWARIKTRFAESNSRGEF
jgi:catechol 2,3-dioxygenase-like lactoylglutathione lyase family enzyme